MSQPAPKPAIDLPSQEVVRSLIAQMRATLENRDGLPQSYVNSRVVNLSSALATLTQESAMPEDLARWSN